MWLKSIVATTCMDTNVDSSEYLFDVAREQCVLGSCHFWLRWYVLACPVCKDDCMSLLKMWLVCERSNSARLTLTQIQSGLQAQWRFNRAEFDCVVRITCLLRNMQIKHSIDIHITIFYATSLRGRRRTKLWIVSDSSGFLRITIDA